LDSTGPVRDTVLSVTALGFALAGHCAHHMKIVKERYFRQLAASV